jgi:hypothetical protein
LTVQVPAIVSREVWELAQARRAKNKADAKRNTKRQYLLRRRLECGACGRAMRAHASVNDCGEWLYYNCNGDANRTPLGRPCNAPGFRADHVDALVWQWLCNLFSDQKVAVEAIRNMQAEREKAVMPMRERLAIIDDLVTDYHSKLERLLDLYLSGDFDQTMLANRKGQLEKTIKGLERERDDLTTKINAILVTDAQTDDLREFVQVTAEGLQEAEKNFKLQRRLIEELHLKAQLTVENGEKIVHVKCLAGFGTLLIESSTTQSREKDIGDARCPSPGPR